MNQYNWYKVFNSDEFEALGLVSKTYTLNLEGIGTKSFLVTKGDMLSVTYDGVFLSIDSNAHNPFEFDGMAIYRDDNNDVFWGIEIEA